MPLVTLELDDRKLLLMLDFDGTLVPIAPTPDAIEVPEQLPGILDDLRGDGHQVWVISGRTAAFVQERVPGVPVVGLHGLQWPDQPDPERSPALDPAINRARDLAQRFPGMLVEDKGLSMGLHVRQVPSDRHAEAWAAACQLAEQVTDADPSLNVLHGHEVVEVRPRAASKSHAVQRLVAAHPALRPLYIGDDKTDEEAFEALPSDGIAVRVGPEEVQSMAPHRLPDVPSVYAFLGTLASR